MCRVKEQMSNTTNPEPRGWGYSAQGSSGHLEKWQASPVALRITVHKKSLPDRNVFRRNPEAEAGHATAGEQTHTAGTKKGVGQTELILIQNSWREWWKIDPTVQAAWQKVLANLITFSAERCEQKPVAGKRPALQGRRRDVDLGAFHSGPCWEQTHWSSSLPSISFLSDTVGTKGRNQSAKSKRAKPLTIRSYLWSLCCWPYIHNWDQLLIIRVPYLDSLQGLFSTFLSKFWVQKYSNGSHTNGSGGKAR